MALGMGHKASPALTTSAGFNRHLLTLLPDQLGVMEQEIHSKSGSWSAPPPPPPRPLPLLNTNTHTHTQQERAAAWAIDCKMDLAAKGSMETGWLIHSG